MLKCFNTFKSQNLDLISFQSLSEAVSTSSGYFLIGFSRLLIPEWFLFGDVS